MYKAIITDLDGTAIPNREDGMPSERLVNIIKKIKEQAYVIAATGRALTTSMHIIKRLGLTTPCIISGGTQIIDPVTEKIIWQKDLDRSQVEAIMRVAMEYPYEVFFSDEVESAPASKKVVKGDERIIYIQPVSETDTDIIIGKLNKIPNVSAHKVFSWTPDHFDIHITHSEATKRHSLEVLLKMLGVHKKDVAAFGDGNNDLPLFESAGYKVAMGNATNDLKKMADIIAPTIDEDGLAVVLEQLFEN